MPSRVPNEQANAIGFGCGQAVVIATAGSGKTFVIKRRYERLLQEGVAAANTLLLSHTRKSAGALASVSNTHSDIQNTFTVHGLSYNLLREFASEVGLGPNITVADAQMARSLLQSAMTQAGMKGQGKGRKPKDLQSYITLRRSGLLSKEEALQRSGFRERKDDSLTSVARDYKAAKKSAGVLDFDDLLHHAFRLVDENPSIRKKLRRRYLHIMVDECQDLSPRQLQIIRRIFGNWKKGEHRSLVFVGDPGQSIYSFHGANYDFLRELTSFSGTKSFPLPLNFRSTQLIIALANALDIKDFEGRRPTEADTDAKVGDTPVLSSTKSEKEEIEAICKLIKANRRAGFAYKSQAILLRTGVTFDVLEGVLKAAGIPVRVVGGDSSKMQHTIASVLVDIFRAANRPDDLALLQKVLKLGSRKMVRTASSRGTLLKRRDALPTTEREAVDLLLRCVKRASDNTRTPLERVKVITKRLQALFPESDGEPSRKSEKAVLDHLRGVAGLCRDAQEFLSALALDPPPTAGSDKSDAITLSTIHGAKGLEWDVVYLPQLKDGQLPFRKSRLIDEERRILYVGVTRARQRLYLSYPAGAQFLAGVTFGRVSRFLSEPGVKKHLRVEN